MRGTWGSHSPSDIIAPVLRLATGTCIRFGRSHIEGKSFWGDGSRMVPQVSFPLSVWLVVGDSFLITVRGATAHVYLFLLENVSQQFSLREWFHSLSAPQTQVLLFHTKSLSRRVCAEWSVSPCLPCLLMMEQSDRG